jgi:hypothetical protein
MVNPEVGSELPRQAAGSDTVDRDARNDLALTIEQFLASQITAFQFDESLDHCRHSRDPVVHYVVDTVWYFYDDCDDHLVNLTKPAWDYFQRLLLLLQSDCSLHTVKNRFWSWTQLIAAICLAIIVAFILRYGWGTYLLLVWMPLGLVSMLISQVRRNGESSIDPFADVITPFATFTDLRVAYGAVRFAKTKYPAEIGDRRIRRVIGENLQQFMGIVAWLFYAPIPLLFQMLPRTTKLIVAKGRAE